MKKNSKKKIFFLSALLLLMFVSVWISDIDVQAAQKKIVATIPRESVTVGKRLRIETKTKDVNYATSDASIATVQSDGIITAKKAGTVNIIVSREGYTDKIFTIHVKRYGNYPSIPVTFEEVGISLNRENGRFDAVISNHSDSGKIKKIELVYKVCIEDQEGVIIWEEAQADEDAELPTEKHQEITLRADHINPGKSKKVAFKGDFDNNDMMTVTLFRVRLYTGKTVLNYNMVTGHMNAEWLIQDTTPPVISGWVGKKGYNAKDVYMVAYSDREYDFTKYVKASDDMGRKVKLIVDTSKINWKKSGVYTITYRAEDMAGNVSKKKAKVQVRVTNELDQMADTILKNIVKDSWSDKKKAEAIYRYMRRNHSYVDSNDHASWENSAKYGLRYHSGNCFVYYSVSRLLLTRCGIPNIEVKRSAGSSHGHWWNYVYIDGGWYHFDTTPRRRRATFCLVTDGQLSAYSRAAGNSHIWDKSLIPKGATKKISAVHWGRSY